MQTKRLLGLVAVATTSALASYEIAAETSEYNEAVPTDASPAGAIQPERKQQSVQAVDILATESAEERGPMPHLGEIERLEKTKARFVANALGRSNFRSDVLMGRGKAVERVKPKYVRRKKAVNKSEDHLQSRIDEIKALTAKYYSNGMTTDDVLDLLKMKHKVVSEGEIFFIKTLLTNLHQDFLDNAKIAIDECVPQGLSEASTIEMVRGHRESLNVDDLDFIKKYYNERFDEITKKEVAEYLAQGLSRQQIFDKMRFMYEKIEHEGIATIVRLCDFVEAEKVAEAFRKVVDSRLAYGVSPDEILVELKKATLWTSQKTEIADMCIREWFEKNDAKIYEVLHEWVAMGESSSLILELVEARRLNPQASLNTRDPLMFIQMPDEQPNPIHSTFMKWLLQNLHPAQAKEEFAQKVPKMVYFKLYEKLYKKAKVDLVRMLATWWKAELKPEDVAERLEVIPSLVHGEEMKQEFSLMYARLWSKKPQD